ncbi:MAG: hypothetical protein AAF497_26270, partial [Planctomycetota bacterium]
MSRSSESTVLLDHEVESRVEAFESALIRNSSVRIADFLPEEVDPRYLTVLTELIRVDMDIQRSTHQSHRALDEYRREFPAVFESSAAASQIAFEDYRLRRSAGESATREEYESQYGIATDEWSSWMGGEPETKRAVDTSVGSHAIQPALDETTIVPGSSWGDFEIVGSVGKGAFAQAFRARQKSLANREVVLKFANLDSSEAHRLALLQHTNIVPIYSVHSMDHHQSVICMPYAGEATLGTVLSSIRTKSPQDGGVYLSALGTD